MAATKDQGNRPGEGKFEGFVKNARVWLADARVRRLPIAKRGIYDDLMCVQWEEGYVADDPKGLGKWLGAKAGDVSAVLEEFFPLTEPGKRHNAKMEAQREHAQQKRKQASTAAKTRHGGKGSA